MNTEDDEFNRIEREAKQRMEAVKSTVSKVHQCQWPTCQSEGYQQALAEQIQRELVGGHQKPLAWTEREIELIDGLIQVQFDHAKRCDSIANRPMAEKQKGWDMERVALLQKIKSAPPAQEFVCSTGLCHYKAQPTWVGLTDKEISEIAINTPPVVHEFARAIEAKLKEKNHGN